MKKRWMAVMMAAVLTVLTIGALPAAASSQADAVSAATSAAEAVQGEGTEIRLAGLKGATSMGMVRLLEEADSGKTADSYSFTLAGSADEITPKLVKGDLDIAAVPVNLGSVLYSKTQGAVEMLAVSTLGVLYIVENGAQDITSWSDLRGRTILATGKGSTPEYALRYLLTQNGLDPDQDVTMEWKDEPTETVSAMAAAGGSTVAMLPQPYVTAAKAKLPDLHVELDLTKSWDDLNNGSRFVTAGLLVRKAFADEHPDAVSRFLDAYADSASYVNEHPAEASKLIEKYGIIKAAVAEKAIPDCHIVCITGTEMKAALSGYLKTLYDQNPRSVGGSLPGGDFYYDAGSDGTE